MNVEIIVRIDDREVACIKSQVQTRAELPLEEQTEQVKGRVGQVLLEVGFARLTEQMRHPCCCGKPMQNKGKRCVTIMSQSGYEPKRL